MTNEKTWTVAVEDLGDGSGDGIVTLPPELLEEVGWNEETPLFITVNDDGSVIISSKEN